MSFTNPRVYCLYFCCSSLCVDLLSRRTEILDKEQKLQIKNGQSIQMFTCNKFKKTKSKNTIKSSSRKPLLLCDYLWIVCAQTLKCWIPSSFPFFLISWLCSKQGSLNLRVEMIKVIIQLFFKTFWIVEGNSHYDVEALHWQQCWWCSNLNP